MTLPYPYRPTSDGIPAPTSISPDCSEFAYPLPHHFGWRFKLHRCCGCTSSATAASMILLSWNCRGLGHPLSVYTLGRLIQDKRPGFLFLMETKSTVSNVNHILRNKGFSSSTGCDPEGLRGGLWVGWRSNFAVSVLHLCKNLILLSVRDDFNLTWRLAFVNGSPYRHQRPTVWSQIESLVSSDSGPLICIEDFNQVLHLTDRLSQTPSTLPGSTNFSQFLFNLSLTELPSAGPHFTWTNNRQAPQCTFE